jgi:hypothetical protein
VTYAYSPQFAVTTPSLLRALGTVHATPYPLGTFTGEASLEASGEGGAMERMVSLP